MPVRMSYVSAAEELFANPSNSTVTNVDMSSFIALFSEIPNRSSTIVCIRVQWNLLGQVGGAPGLTKDKLTEMMDKMGFSKGA